MNGEIKRITLNKKGFITILIKVDEKTYGRTFTGDKYRNYAIWSDFQIGDQITGLAWKDESKGIIDADSPVYLIH